MTIEKLKSIFNAFFLQCRKEFPSIKYIDFPFNDQALAELCKDINAGKVIIELKPNATEWWSCIDFTEFGPDLAYLNNKDFIIYAHLSAVKYLYDDLYKAYSR